MVCTEPPLIASVPAASVLTEAARTVPPKVVAPLLFTVRAPRRVVSPTALKLAAPLPACTVKATAPLTLLPKLMPVPVSCVSAPSATAPL